MLVKKKLKYIQSLGQKKFRNEEGVYVAEGPRVLKELLTPGVARIREIFAVSEWLETHRHQLHDIPVQEISESELQGISGMVTAHQVLAIVEQEHYDIAELPLGQVSLVLDDIRDPGNLGTLIRIADWFGIEFIICSRESAEAYNPKVVQATMGSIARVKVVYKDLLPFLKQRSKLPMYCAALNGEQLATFPRINEGVIVIGNEASGIDQQIVKLADHKVRIPGKGKAESLNAAVAAGIILSHLT